MQKNMEIKIDQVTGYMDSLFKERDFETLKNIAQQVSQQRPEIATAWRYLGIIATLSGGDKKSLQKAAALGDAEAELWLSVVSEFEYHPKGSIHP